MSNRHARQETSPQRFPPRGPGLLGSLRAKLLIAFLAVSLVPLAVVFFFNIQESEQALSRAAYQSLFAAATRTAAGLDAFIQNNLDLIGAEARLPALSEYLSLHETKAVGDRAQKRIQGVLKTFIRRNAVFISSYALLDLRGRIVVGTKPSDVGSDLSGRSYFRAALLSGLPFASTVEFSANDGKPYLYFSCPVYSPADKPLGILCAKYSAAVLQQHIVKDGDLAGAQSFAMLADENHLILASGLISPGGSSELLFKTTSPLNEEMLTHLQKLRRLPAGSPRHVLFHSPDLDKALNAAGGPEPFSTARLSPERNIAAATAVAKMESLPWRVVFFQPRESFLTPIKAQTRERLLFALLVTCVVAVMAIGMARLLAKPITQLTAMARMMGAGELDVETRVKSGGEIGALADTLNHMAQRLGDSINTLREKNKELEREAAERKRAESDLSRMAAILETTSDMASMAAPDGRIIYMNAAGRRMLGWPLDEPLHGKAIMEAHAQWAYELIEKQGIPTAVRDGAWMGETALLGPDGGEIPVSQVIVSHKSPDGKLEYISTIIRDMSEAKKAEQALRTSEEKLAKLFKTTPVWISVTAMADGRYVDVNDAFVEISGFSRQEAIGRTSVELGLWSNQEERNQYLETLQYEGSFKDVEVVITKKNGRRATCLWSAELMDLDSKPHILSAVTDITSRKRGEEALKLSEERYRILFDSISDFIYTHELDGRILTINPMAARSLGYAPEELVGKNLKDFMPADAKAAFEENFTPEILRKGRREGVLILIDKQGRDHNIEYRSSLAERREGGTIVSGSGRDITERILSEQRLRKIEEQLAHSQKMEAVGALAGGIAHDFNNILMAILGHSELGLKAARDGKASPQAHEQVIKAVEHAKKLIQQILTFSRKASFALKPLNINTEISKTVPLIERIIPKMIQVELHLADDLKLVAADANQVEQIILNLSANAVDAMPDGGRLVIETESTTLDEEYSREHLDAPSGEYVLLRVTDTGHGMDAETLKNIFDPFFTTKEVGKGTGLGLSTVFGIVKGHNGRITCYSEAGRGTAFNIFFPALPAGEEEAAAEAATIEDIPGGDETILVVDDEQVIRELGCEMLAGKGYQTMSAESGEEALSIYQGQTPDIDLVILDVNMPGMGGHRCLEELLKINPAARVVIASGYSRNGRLQEILASGAAGYIAKPFKMAALFKAVREALDA